MDQDQVCSKLKKELRSLLISAPRGVALPLLTKDYKMVMGKELPYREMGYRTVEQFIDSIPDTIRLGHGPAGLTCYAVANAETQQIARFVASQKKPALKKSLMPPAVVLRKPGSTSGFSKKFHFGPRPKKYFNKGGPGGVPSGAGRQYVPAGYQSWGGGGGGGGRGGVGGGANKFGKPFHTKPSVSVSSSNIPPRLRSASEFTPATSGSTHIPRPSSTSSLPAYAGKSSVSQGRTAISPVRYPGHARTTTAQPAPTRSKDGGGVYPWKKELERAESISINQLNSSDVVKLVYTTGYIASLPIKDSSVKNELIVKRLLFTEYAKATRSGRGYAVLLVFKEPPSVRTHEFSASVCDMAEGTKLKVYGDAFVHNNKKKNKNEPGIFVHYYEKLDESLSNGRSSTPSSLGSPTSSRSASPPSSNSTSQLSASDLQSLNDNIVTILTKHPNGVYARRLAKEYEKDIKKSAPPDILQYTMKLPFVTAEEIVEGNPILTLIESKVPSSVTMATRNAVSAPTTPTTSTTPTVTFVTEKPSLPVTVELGGAGEVLNVQVVFIESVVSFYVQRIGEEFSDKFQAMEKKMSAYLSKNAVSPLTPISEEQLYGLRWYEEDSGSDEIWCRVLIRSIQKAQGKAYVLCPDFGNSLLVSTSELKDLPREFYQLPFQAVHCCLDGLRGIDYVDEDKAYEAVARLALNKMCIAQVMENSGTRVSVELIDSDSDGKDTINSLLLQRLCPAAVLAPKLPEPGAGKVPVKFTDIDMDGVVTVQLPGPGLSQLDYLMNIINETYQKPRAADFIQKVEVGMVCCGVFSSDHKWYRVVIKEATPSRKYLVEFVDYGNEELVEKSKLRKKVDHHLFNLPFQGVKCTLHSLPPPEGTWTDSAIDVAMEFMDCDNLYLQVVEAGDVAGSRLPSIRLLMSNDDDEKEAEEREEEILDVNNRLFSDKSLFGVGPALSDVSVSEADVPTPANSSTPERQTSASDGVPSSNSSFSRALNELSEGVRTMKLSVSDNSFHTEPEESKNNQPSIASIGVQEDRVRTSPTALGGEECPRVSYGATLTRAAELGCALNGNGGAIRDVVSPQQEAISFEVGSNGRLVAELEESEQLLKVEDNCESHQLLTPPSGSDNLSVFSPHTPAGSPSHVGSSPFHSSKVVPSESSNSLSSGGQFSPHTPQSRSPACGGTPVHSVLGAANIGGGVHSDINKVKAGLNFASLELKCIVPVIVSWAASPNKFNIQLVNNLIELDSMTNSLTEAMNQVVGSTSFSLSFDAIRPGLVCCAFSDEQWFRVLVLESPPTYSSFDVNVEFLDCGGTERVALSSLRQLPQKFRELPFQGIPSSLCNITPIGGCRWSSEALEYFESLYNCKQLFAVALSKDPTNTYFLFLLDTSTVPGSTLNLGQELVKKGFAKNVNPISE